MPDYQAHDEEILKLRQLSRSLEQLPPQHQRLIAELVVLRLFDLFVNLISAVALKLACGRPYADGTVPNLLMKARSSADAERLCKAHNRRTPLKWLTWTSARNIKKAIGEVIDKNDPVVKAVDSGTTLIGEMRRVRNRIAHRSRDSRKQFREVVRLHYGAYLNNVTPGVLLLTKRKKPPLLQSYIDQERLLAKAIVRAP